MHIERLKLLSKSSRQKYFEKILDNGDVNFSFIDKEHLEINIDSEIFIINRTDLIDSILKNNRSSYSVKYGVYYVHDKENKSNPYKTIVEAKILLNAILKNNDIKILYFDEKCSEDIEVLSKIQEFKNI